jgi:hypothetical protein
MTGKPGRKCQVCASQQLAEITRALTNGETFESIAFEYGFAKSSLHRHATLHQGIKKNNTQGGKRASRGSGSGSPKRAATKSRSVTDDGRCSECGGMTTLLESEALDGKALIWRAEKLLHLAEKIALEAKDAGDARLCLIALEKAQKSLETLLRVAGLLKPESVVVDARTVNVYQNWSTPSLEALNAFHDALAGGASIAEAIAAVTQNTPALPA